MRPPESILFFLPFRLEKESETLWKGTERVPLRSKSFGVLIYLVERAGQLVTKQELLEEIWPDTAVSDAVLKVCIQEIREALGDNPKNPSYIETRARKGYRFIAKAQREAPVVPAENVAATPFVGRTAELQRLTKYRDFASRGNPQILFVTGEAGIGKSTLVERFIQELQREDALIAQSACVELFEDGEAYMPVLDIVRKLTRSSHADRVRAVLRDYAPTWLIQLPGVLADSEFEALRHRVPVMARERMLREIAEAFEALSQSVLLALVIEDVHWADRATLDLIAFLASRRTSTRLLLLATYRSEAVQGSHHPLHGIASEIVRRGLGHEISLECLSEKEVGQYVVARTGHAGLQEQIQHALHRHTDGHPLFMVNVTDYLLAQDLLSRPDARISAASITTELGVPEDLQRMIHKQLDLLERNSQRVLEAGSICGADFSTAEIASALEQNMLEVEDECEKLARRGQFLRSQGTVEWPDGTTAATYAFIHALYQNALYSRVSGGKKSIYHGRVAARLEQGYGKESEIIATRLAVHFEQNRDDAKAVKYWSLAANHDLARFANEAAIGHLERALHLLRGLGPSEESARTELRMQMALGAALIAARGYASHEVGAAYERAKKLGEQVGSTSERFAALWGMWVLEFVRGDSNVTEALSKEIARIAKKENHNDLLVEAQVALGLTTFSVGKLEASLDNLDKGVALYKRDSHSSHAFIYGQDPGVVCLTWGGWTQVLLGYPKEGAEKAARAIALAEDCNHPHSLAYALGGACIVHQLRREPNVVHTLSTRLVALCEKHGFPLWLVLGKVLQGWSTMVLGRTEEGLALIQEGIDKWGATGAGMGLTYMLTLLAEGFVLMNQYEQATFAIDLGLARVESFGERHHESELYRMKGELLLASIPAGTSEEEALTQAMGLFEKALEIAQNQSAKLLELRARVSLCKHGSKQGGHKSHLETIYKWFKPPMDLEDLKEAEALL